LRQLCVSYVAVRLALGATTIERALDSASQLNRGGTVNWLSKP
jgi:hypothetical protein